MKLTKVQKKFRTLTRRPKFAKFYAIAALAVLALTTTYWTWLSVKLQFSNSDQFVDPYFFESHSTLQAAVLPGQHTFLLKWPLFWLIRLFHYSAGSFYALTLLVVLATVGGLAYIIYKIERRPLVFGTLCLALASVLLLVPAQPYAGGLLPVNMGMLTTRNLEYLLYIAGLIFVIKSPALRSPRFWAGAVLLALVIASDKLFLSFAAGGALLALVVYALRRHWKAVSLSVRWLLAAVAGGVGAFILLGLAGGLKLIHVASQASASPYALARGIHDLALGVIYGAMGLLTNFGANPAFDATRLGDILHNSQPRLVGLSGPAFIINLIVFGCLFYVATRFLLSTVRLRKAPRNTQDIAGQLSLTLLWSSLAAAGVFVATNHYYAVDARYLTLLVFALFITFASHSRSRKWKAERLALTGLILLLGIISALYSSTLTYHNQRAALSDVNQRDKIVSQVLQKHPAQVLVGDYWRVLPIKFQSGSRQPVMPLQTCAQPRQTLTSLAWNLDLRRHGFAYLLSLDRSLTDFPRCDLNQIIASYGRPNASTVVAGSLTSPRELLLFYDQGSHVSSPSRAPLPQQSATVLPISPDEVPFTSCSVPTVMNIVAHQDDDLLFMNPDLVNDIRAKHCIRTIYVTAGDSGNGSYYWLGRERGSEAAYSNMLGLKNQIWIERTVKLGEHQFATVASPKGDSKISLIFLHLPDGNLKGDGFRSSGYESLAKLEEGKISNLHSVDAQSKYSISQLADALTVFMHIYQPAEIRTQANYASSVFPDHSDHMAVGRLARRAYTAYESQQFEDRLMVPLKFYIGYPVRTMSPNVNGADLQIKEDAFLSYAKFDDGVCGNIQKCAQTPTYNAYLARQYTNPE